MGRGTVLFILLALLIAACGGEEAPEPTSTPEPTATFYPTHTPYPANTPYPSHTPGPTNTQAPANTPKPTTTPTKKPNNTPTSLPVTSLGEGVQTDNVVLVFSEAKQTQSLQWQDQVLQPDGHWVIVYGEAHNPNKGEVWLYPHNFVLTSSSLGGYIFVDEEATEVVEQQSGIESIVVGHLGSGIKSGETVPVAVAFDVPDMTGQITLWVVDARTGIDLGSAEQFTPLQTRTATNSPTTAVTAILKPTRTPTPRPTDTPTALPTRGPGTDIAILSNHSYYVDDFDDVHVVGEIRNDTGYSVSPVEIRTDFYNSNGNLVGTGIGFSNLLHLPAGERTCFNTQLEAPANWSRYKFQLPIYELVGEPLAPDLTISDDTGSYDSEFGWYSIIGQVHNGGDFRARFVELIGTLYDASGTVIGCESDWIDYIHIDPGQTSFFELSFMDRDYSDAVSYRLQIYGEPIELADPSDPFGPTSAKGMGVSRSKVMDALEPLEVKFEPEPGPRGEFYVVGRKGEGLLPNVDVDLIGPSDDLLRTRIGVFLSSEFSEPEAMRYIETFLQVTARDWGDGMDWVRANLSKAKRGDVLRTVWKNLEIGLWASEVFIYVSVSARR